jgi:Catalytic LigB subunit of aromatic ring-opening dioxygenase
MADIVIGVASSHTPQLSSGVDMWFDHAERDRRNPQLLGKDARYHSYDELLAEADPAIERELAPEIWERKYQRAQEAIEALGVSLGKANPDIVIVVGDDQREMFTDDGIPAFACFTGPELVDMPPGEEALQRVPKGIRAAYWAVHADHPATHPVARELSAHVAERLARDDFDLTVVRQQPAGRTLGHAFTFPRYRLGLPHSTPIVPLFVNTYYPPNVPSAARAYQLGRALRRAVESWSGDARVAVVASGGLSHFVVDEALDHRVLDGLTSRDASALGSLSRDQLRSGNSEILNWIVAAGALEDLAPSVLDYVPGYRTPAGTGAGMAFARWE